MRYDGKMFHSQITQSTKAQAEARIVDGVDKKDLTHLGKADIPYYVLTTLYATELKERKEGLSRLNMQMQRFNNDF